MNDIIEKFSEVTGMSIKASKEIVNGFSGFIKSEISSSGAVDMATLGTMVIENQEVDGKISSNLKYTPSSRLERMCE